ncbi:hypothetical protein PHMEG_0008795 [Phytophthora megakarya]|uniref:Uncharacterized protein n=1 Tax=Phytophthora megakarya TaxID=4795 RepID=A0A225WHV0_9STRA|nr:hypothetical protein PHMEG_0008795 [Phytophthora megakarya]
MHRQVAFLYFKLCLDKEGEQMGYYSCKSCGKIRKHTPKTSYTNLMSPVRIAHPNYKLDMRNDSVAATGTLLPWVTQKSSNRYTKLNGISVETLAASHQGCRGSDRRPRASVPFLSLAPVIEEPDDHLNTDSHLTAIKRYLPFFGKSIGGYLFLVGDHCGVNKRLANLFGGLQVGCASDRLNLAVREYLGPHDSILEDV